jgi:D-cysteine desulfhydrase family pyridoxal phosphate-dependent enzyme
MPDFFAQPREHIATLPTPLQFMPRLTAALSGPHIYLKRDDLTGLAFGGNKTRKLEYLIADAKQKGATHFITEGGVQSNHVRQAAAAARLGGMQAELVLNTPDDDPPLQGNLLIDDLLGAHCHYVPTGPDRKPKMAELANQIKSEGGVPYVVVSGGSDAVGALGYVGMILEMNAQLVEQGVSPRCVYVANGSAGTQAGMLVGQSLFGGGYTIKGYCVVPGGAQEITQDTLTLANRCAARIGADPVDPLKVVCDDTQFGEAYGQPTPEALEAIKLLAHTEAVLLDPVYSSKAFAGMIADIRAGIYRDDDAIVFVHTGGTPALFAKVDMLGPILTR